MKTRIYIFYGLLMIAFLMLAGRLVELQLIFGARNRILAEGNRIRKVTLPAPRGIIYDRTGKELVRNVPLYRVKEQKTITRDEALKIEARGGSEVENLRTYVGRDYVYGPVLAHLLGYLGELDENEVKQNKGSLGDLTGRTGVEEQYNWLLKGTNGGELFEVDATGAKIREIGKSQPIPGKDVNLSIEAELSKVAFEALEARAILPAGRQGAVVATEAKTGRILVLVSSPSFNPQNLTPEILNDSGLPLFNRAIGGVYPPGSTFKIVTAAAGLEEKKINANTLFEDPGVITVGDYAYKNWYFTQYGKTEGSLNIVKALKRSTDTFFYKVGEWVGPDKLSDWAEIFGLGKITGIDLSGETAGLVPNPEWKEKTTGERWFLGNTYHLAIGQSDLLTTPIQVNMMASVIANKGKLCLPRVKMPESERVENCRDLKLESTTIDLIKEGMKEACSIGGTAFPFFDFKPPVACKTGTAEYGPLIGGKRKTHAWLTAFAPIDEPEIVVTAIVEGGGEGSYVAAPIVKKVMEKWFGE